MKKLLTTLHVSALLIIGSLQVSASAEDSTATLNINGTVGKGIASACTMKLDKATVKLTGNTSTMINQNEPIKEGEDVVLTLNGGAECYQLAEQGKLIYKIMGNADNADGTVLANNDTSANAATGIGIGIYNIHSYNHNQQLRINKDSVKVNPLVNAIGLTMVKLNGKEVRGGNVQGTLTIQIERL